MTYWVQAWIFIFHFLIACLACGFSTPSGLSFNAHTICTPIFLSILVIASSYLFPRRLRILWLGIIGELLLIICLADGFCNYRFGSGFSPQILELMQQTDFAEVKEFFRTFVNGSALLQPQIGILVFLLLSFPVLMAYPWSRMPSWKESRAYYIIVSLLVCVTLIFELPGTFHFGQLLSPNNTPQQIETYIFRHYAKDTPTPIHRLIYASSISKRSIAISQQIKESTFSAQIDSCTHLSPHVVLIVGESYNKHHSQLYGYSNPTTPCQQQLLLDGKLYCWQDAVSPWNLTCNVLLSMFSCHTTSAEQSIEHYPLFPILFRRAGYHVRFFTNQNARFGIHKGFSNAMGNFFLSDSQMNDSLFDYRNNQTYPFDESIAQLYIDSISNNWAYTLDIIHLHGQHFEYSKRYPEHRAIFDSTSVQRPDLTMAERQMIAEYDNATRYNDSILNLILEANKHRSAIVLYVADHGEEVYDDNRHFQGRYYGTPTADHARNEYEVPFWIWCSESYRASHPAELEWINNLKKEPILTDQTSLILLHLGGIHSSTLPDISHDKRMLMGSVDYDQLL